MEIKTYTKKDIATELSKRQNKSVRSSITIVDDIFRIQEILGMFSQLADGSQPAGHRLAGRRPSTSWSAAGGPRGIK